MQSSRTVVITGASSGIGPALATAFAGPGARVVANSRQRLGTTAEIVDAVMCREHAPFVSGEVLHVDGGAHACKW